MKVWITKYALTSGIFEAEATPMTNCKGGISIKRYLTEHFHGKDWHLTREEAIIRAKEMQQKKVSSLLKQISKIESIKL
jgi:hypothetical protein